MNSQYKRRWWVLGALAIGILAVGLDMTILNLALPILATDMQATNGELQWFADAYNLVFAAALLPAGLLGDRLGRKKMLIIGLIIFGAASLVCAYSSSPWELITGRALLGLGAALLVPLSMSIIPVMFSEKERPKAIGVWMMANAFGIPLGPVLGGWLLDNYWWGSVFLINIPLIVIALFAVSFLLPESRGLQNQRMDLIGILTSSVGLVGVTYGVIEVGERGWGDITAITTILTGLVLLVVFMLWERRTSHPLIDPALFRSRSFTWGTVLATVVSFAMFGVLFVMPQYFQAVEGVDALSAGLRLLPLVGGLLVGSQVSDLLQSRFGTKVTLSFGFLVLGIALVIGANTGVTSDYGFASIWVTLVGLGIGFALPAAMDEAMSALTAETSGVGSALLMALRQVGGTMGVAILGTILSSGYRSKLDLQGLPAEAVESIRRNVSAGVAVARQIHSNTLIDSVKSSFVHGMGITLWVCAGVAVIGVLITMKFVKTRVHRNEVTDVGV
ncbi:DHA2 family efflux MFS transporter permease subunit [Paenibacillus solani]|uniref:Multidrug MFS transporter n=1 Tax=Paenibacillus solani TaxID=1705565 RepID=A0A0M1P004_9BACL|nr:DHA2 family efflux MFS transporter permease subunit [Paenibacillus solani]KOR87595.1 multidrug MFS transporter [Paenibacillus solani]